MITCAGSVLGDVSPVLTTGKNVTRLESVIAVLIGIISIIGTMLGAAWKVKGWVDNLAETDRYLAQYVVKLDDTLKAAHKENQRRFTQIVRKLDRNV